MMPGPFSKQKARILILVGAFAVFHTLNFAYKPRKGKLICITLGLNLFLN